MTPSDAAAWQRHLPAGVALDAALDAIDAGSTLVQQWLDIWAADPSAPLLYGDDHGWVSRGEFEESTRRVAQHLAASGVEPGDRVVLSGPTTVATATAYVACLRAGAVVVPANTMYRQRELDDIVSDAEARLAILDDPGRWKPSATTRVIPLDSKPSPRALDSSAVLDAARPTDLGGMVYTSGTTGRPKGAMLAHRNLAAAARMLDIAWRWQPDDRLVLALPLFHVHGLCVGLHGVFLAGASAVLRNGFDAADVCTTARQHQATMFFGVPTMYHRLANCPEVGALSALRLCVSGSAPLPADLCVRFGELTGQQVLERYGMSETLMNLSNPYDHERRPGTVGFALPGVRTRIADNDELLVQGPNVFAGYWNRADVDSFDNDGWFHTGDLAEISDDGYVRLLGRAKELIITGGFNVYPVEVEDVLRLHPGVDDAAVVGIPDDEWGERVVAFIVGDAPVDELGALAKESLAAYKQPRQWQVIDEIPKNAMGKTSRKELVSRLTEDQR